MYMCICVCAYIYICIYIWKMRVSGIHADNTPHELYIYIYIYTHTVDKNIWTSSKIFISYSIRVIFNKTSLAQSCFYLL